MTKLRERMIEDLRVRNYSIHTEQAYVRYVRRFAEHFGRSPAQLGSEEVRAFLVHLQKNGASSPTISSAGAALRFLYKYTLGRPCDPDPNTVTAPSGISSTSSTNTTPLARSVSTTRRLWTISWRT